MVNIPLDAVVECTDGEYGQSVRVVLNPVTRQVTAVVVRRKGHAADERVVPLRHVTRTTAKRIVLNCSISDVAAMRPLFEHEFVPVEHPTYDMYGPQLAEPFVAPMTTDQLDVMHENISREDFTMVRGASVMATDGKVGEVDEFVVDPQSGNITHITLRRGHLWGKKEIVLPISAVARGDRDHVYLKLDKKSVKALPAFPVRRSYGWDDAKFELIAIVFEGEEKAKEALDMLKEQKDRGTIAAVRDAAVLVKHADGSVAIDDQGDWSGKKGALFGAVAGGLLGLLGGPIGIGIAAAAGAAVGGTAAGAIDRGLSNDYLKELRDYLQPGSSALVAVVEHGWATSISDVLEPFNGQVFQQAVPDEIVTQLVEKQDDGESGV